MQTIKSPVGELTLTYHFDRVLHVHAGGKSRFEWQYGDDGANAIEPVKDVYAVGQAELDYLVRSRRQLVLDAFHEAQKIRQEAAHTTDAKLVREGEERTHIGVEIELERPLEQLSVSELVEIAKGLGLRTRKVQKIDLIYKITAARAGDPIIEPDVIELLPIEES